MKKNDEMNEMLNTEEQVSAENNDATTENAAETDEEQAVQVDCEPADSITESVNEAEEQANTTDGVCDAESSTTITETAKDDDKSSDKQTKSATISSETDGNSNKQTKSATPVHNTIDDGAIATEEFALTKPRKYDGKQKSSFAALLESDFFKLYKHKSVWIGMAVMFAVALVVFAIYWILLIGNEKNPETDSALANGINAAAGAIFAEFGKSSLTGFSKTSYLTLIVMIVGCIFVGKEFSNGTMRIMVSRGANKTEIFFSKWIVLATLTVMYSLYSLLICGILSSFKWYGTFTAKDFGCLMANIGLQLLCNISTMSFVLMLAFLCRSSGGALGACIGASLGINLLVTALTFIIPAFTSQNSSPIATDWQYFMPLQQITVAGLDFANVKVSTGQLCAAIIMPIVHTGFAMLVGALPFVKKDIK